MRKIPFRNPQRLGRSFFPLTILATVGVIAFFLTTTACSAKRPNVVLVTIDTIRADHCSAYGYDRETTPVMKRIAESGVLFAHAYAPMATTSPSHATMFTSLHPRTHGVLKNGLGLNSRWTTLAEILRTDGYQTAAVVSSYPLDSRYGLDQGFDHYDDEFEADGRELKPTKWAGIVVDSFFDRDCRVTTRNALDWLRKVRDPERPFFLWVHYFDPHGPYEPPEPFLSQFVEHPTENRWKRPIEETIARYDAEIRETDEALGNLVQALDDVKDADEPILIIAGDHGEGLMQHGHMAHGVHLYEEAVRIPLLFRHSRLVRASQVIEAPVQLLDLAPTILALTGSGLEQPQFFGVNLFDVMNRKMIPDQERPVFLQRRLYKSRMIQSVEVRGQKYGIRLGRWKYIEAPDEGTRELYDLAVDPGETENLTEVRSRTVEELTEKLQSLLRSIPLSPPEPEGTISDQEAEMLRAMGYLE